MHDHHAGMQGRQEGKGKLMAVNAENSMVKLSVCCPRRSSELRHREIVPMLEFVSDKLISDIQS